MKLVVSKTDTPDQLFEGAVELITRGLYRTQEQQGPKVAAKAAMRILDHIRADWLALEQLAAKREKDRE